MDLVIPITPSNGLLHVWPLATSCGNIENFGAFKIGHIIPIFRTDTTCSKIIFRTDTTCSKIIFRTDTTCSQIILSWFNQLWFFSTSCTRCINVLLSPIHNFAHPLLSQYYTITKVLKIFLKIFLTNNRDPITPQHLSGTSIMTTCHQMSHGNILILDLTEINQA